MIKETPETPDNADTSAAPGTTHFGFRQVAEDEKAGLVRGVFDSVASKYDLMNDLMSLGIHRLWKAAMLDWLRPRPGMTLLDVGGVTGDAARLPFPDNSFDAYTTAFCIRNVTHPQNALAEARRVLKPGGRFLCLEFSKVALPVLDEIYDRWSFKVLPVLGEKIAGDRASYQYLAESIRRFPPQEEFKAMIGAAGLARADYRNLTGGIAAIHSAWRT